MRSIGWQLSGFIISRNTSQHWPLDSSVLILITSSLCSSILDASQSSPLLNGIVSFFQFYGAFSWYLVGLFRSVVWSCGWRSMRRGWFGVSGSVVHLNISRDDCGSVCLSVCLSSAV